MNTLVRLLPESCLQTLTAAYFRCKFLFLIASAHVTNYFVYYSEVSAWRALGSRSHSKLTTCVDLKMKVHIIPALQDNYMYLVINSSSHVRESIKYNSLF